MFNDNIPFGSFSSPIPYQFLANKKKEIPIIFDVFTFFTYDAFVNEFDLVPLGLYSVYIRLIYSDDSYLMAGSQFGFEYKSSNDLENLWEIVVFKVDNAKNIYNQKKMLRLEVVYVELCFRSAYYKSYSDFSLDNSTPFFSTSETMNILSAKKKSPLSVNQEFLGNALKTEFDSNNKLTHVLYNSDGITYDILDLIKKKEKFNIRVKIK